MGRAVDGGFQSYLDWKKRATEAKIKDLSLLDWGAQQFGLYEWDCDEFVLHPEYQLIEKQH